MIYDKLSKELKKMQKQYTERDYEYVVLGESIRAIGENQILLDELDATNEQLAKYTEWVSVDVLLPTEDGDYLVVTKNDRGTRRRQVSSFRLSGDGTCYSWGIETSPVYTVVAWAEMMPMWEEEKDGD